MLQALEACANSSLHIQVGAGLSKKKCGPSYHLVPACKFRNTDPVIALRVLHFCAFSLLESDHLYYGLLLTFVYARIITNVPSSGRCQRGLYIDIAISLFRHKEKKANIVLGCGLVCGATCISL